jgi:hypothetical protein
MRFVDRIGAALVDPRRALAEADAGAGGLGDAATLLLLKVVCGETQVLVAGLWGVVVVGPAPALRALMTRVSSVLGLDLILLVLGGLAVTLLAGRRRSASRDFDLAAVAWVPVLAVDTLATAVTSLAGIDVSPLVRQLLWALALAWMAVVLALAVGQARART